MANVQISQLADAILPIDTSNTFFELQTVEGGIQVSRKLSAQDLGIGGGVTGVNSGVNITVDNTDPQQPIVNLNAAITGVSVNSVTLSAAGAATNYLDETGVYSVPPGGASDLQGAYDGGNTILINGTPDPIQITASVSGQIMEVYDTGAQLVFQILDTGVIAGDPGFEGAGIDVGGTIYDSVLKASTLGGTNIAQFIMHRHSSSFAPFIVGSRSQGDTSAHVIVNDGDELLRFWGVGWDGAAYQVGASMGFRVDGTPGLADMPGEIVWSTTPDGSAGVVERMRLRQDGQFEIDQNITILERAAAFGSVATRGQIWVRNDAPNTLMFTDDLGSDVTLSIPFTATEDGLVPLSGGGTTNFLRADGAWVPAGGGVTVEDEGTPLATVADTLNFVGAGVTATGAGTTKTITIPGAGAGTLAGLTDVDLTGQAQYDLLFNVDGTNWEDSAGNVLLNTASSFLQLANGYGLHIVDSGASSLRVLEIASSGTPSVTIEHATVEVIAEVSTTSTTEVDVPGGVLPVLTEGNEYLLIACAQHHQGNTGGENIHGADIAVATQSGVPFSNMRDDIEPPACAPASNQGQWFGGINQIQYANATHGQIRLEHSAGATATHYVNNAILMAFNLTDFGTENIDWFNSTTAPFVTVTDAGWTNLSPSITIGDGVSDWLIFGSFQIDQPSPADSQIQVGLFDGSVNTEYAMHEFEDTADIKSLFFSAVVTGIASTTFQTAARAVAASGDQARIFTSGIYALRLNRFAQYSIQSGAGPTNPGSGAEFSLLTDSVVATTASDWGIMAFAQNRWVGNTLSGTHYGRANINAGGFTTIAGFDTPPVSVVENAAVERTPKFLCPRITELTGVVATDTVGAELRWIPATTFATDEASLYNMVMFTWDTVDTSVEATTLGDPTVDTQLDGIVVKVSADLQIITGNALTIFDAADADTVSIEINTTTMAPAEALVFDSSANVEVFSFDKAINIDAGDLNISGATSGVEFYRYGDAVSHSLKKDASGLHMQVVAGRFRLTADSIQQGEVATPATNVAGQGQWWVRDHVPNQPWFTDDADIDYPVGYGRPRFFTTNASYDMNTGDNAENCINGQAYFDDGSPYTITLEDSGSLEFDVNTPFQIVNAGSGTITVAEGTGDTLFVLDGTAGTVTDAAGSATLGTGAVATVQRTAAGTWLIWGSGITP